VSLRSCLRRCDGTALRLGPVACAGRGRVGAVRFDSDRRYQLAVAPAELWAALARVEDYQGWWPWLRAFDAAGLEGDDVWHCHVQPPVPYRVRFSVALDEVRAPHSVRATISGDVVGEARLEIAEHPGGSEARLVSSLEPGNGFLRAVARLAAPVVRFGHDWVLDTGARQFIDRAV
jgi:uncharacterized protein YndB with AHSA1/START domain